MGTSASQSVTRSAARRDRPDSARRAPVPLTPVPVAGGPVLQRQHGCACGGGCPRCRQRNAARPKLEVGAPGDVYEREADRVAEQVMRMPDPRGSRPGPSLAVQRHAPAVRRKCAACAEARPDGLPDEDEFVQAKGPAGHGAQARADVWQQVSAARGHGEPLTEAVRAHFEPRFGYDFGGVRVHTDARAAESAHSLDALAYTVGRDIVFGAGQYAPETDAGRRLLAHELTHVIQQSPGPHAQTVGVSRVTDGTIQRQNTLPPDSTTVTATPQGPNVCTSQQIRLIDPAVVQAQRWLDRAISLMTQHLNPNIAMQLNFAVNMPWDIEVLAALRRHFHATDHATATQVHQRLVNINSDLTTSTTFTVECHAFSDPQCGASGAYVSGASWVFCPSFFYGEGSHYDEWRSETLVHETAHTLLGGPHITDRAYRSDRLYRLLPTAEALTNAESYALLVQELGTRRAQESTAPTDNLQSCPDYWQPLIQMALARAQRWNRNAQVAVSDRRSSWLSGWLDLQTTYLGVTTPAGSDPATNPALITALDNAKTVYDLVRARLRPDLNITCDTGGGGLCATFIVHWPGAPPSPLHLCPGWRNLATESDRIWNLLRSLYGYLGGLPDSQATQRANLASLARDLNSRFWS